MDGVTESQELRLLRSTFQEKPGSEAFIPLAHHLCDIGRPEEAEHVCRKALAGAAPEHRGRLVLARALADRGRIKEAQDALAELAKYRSDDAEVWVQLSALVVRRGEKARALALLEYAESLGASGPTYAAVLSQVRGNATARNDTRPPPIPKGLRSLTPPPPPDDRPRPVAGELRLRSSVPAEPTQVVLRRGPRQLAFFASAGAALAFAAAWMLLHG